MKGIKWMDNISNEEIFNKINERRTLLRVTKKRMDNWIGRILRANGIRGNSRGRDKERDDKIKAPWLILNAGCHLKTSKLKSGVDMDGDSGSDWDLPHARTPYDEIDNVC